MTEKQFTIRISKLEEAHNLSDREWLEETFKKARQIIEADGRVTITQEFSDRSSELISVIDSLEELKHLFKKYL